MTRALQEHLEKAVVVCAGIFLLWGIFDAKAAKILLMIMLAAILVKTILSRGQDWPERFFIAPGLRYPVFAFYAACLLSVALSIDPYHSQKIFFSRYAPYAGFMIAGIWLGRTHPAWLSRLMYGFLLLQLVLGAGMIRDYFFYAQTNPAMVERLWSTFGIRIEYYGLPVFLSMFIPFCCACVIKGRRVFLQLVSLAALACLIPSLALNSSRIAMAGVIAGMLFVVATMHRKKAAIGMLIAALFITGLLAVPQARQRLKTVRTPAEWSNRIPLYRAALSMIRDQPVMGTGLGTFEKVLHWPKYELPEDYPVPRELNLHAHNTYLEVAAETGLIGGICFLWIFAAFFLHAWKAVKDDPYPFTAGLSAAMLSVLVFAFGSTILTVGITVPGYFWFLFGVSLGSVTSRFRR